MRRAIVVLVLVGASVALLAQTPAAPAFEVASIKQNVSNETLSTFSWGQPRPASLPANAPTFGPPGMVTLTNATLRTIIVQSYEIPFVLERFILTGGSEKVLTTRFDVRAKPADGTPPEQMRPMLKTLLADRFKLRMHTETRQIPIYAVTVAREGKLGPQMRLSNYDCLALRKAGLTLADANRPVDSSGRDLCFLNNDFPGGGVMGVRFAGPLSELASRAQAFVDRAVVDATGLTGNYEWQLTFTMRDSPDSAVPSIYTAFQEQLGLKLEPRTGPFEVYVIDSVEMPTPD
jgi:uncharacterized protein (TIGR03435 family)